MHFGKINIISHPEYSGFGEVQVGVGVHIPRLQDNILWEYHNHNPNSNTLDLVWVGMGVGREEEDKHLHIVSGSCSSSQPHLKQCLNEKFVLITKSLALVIING